MSSSDPTNIFHHTVDDAQRTLTDDSTHVAFTLGADDIPAEEAFEAAADAAATSAWRRPAQGQAPLQPPPPPPQEGPPDIWAIITHPRPDSAVTDAATDAVFGPQPQRDSLDAARFDVDRTTGAPTTLVPDPAFEAFFDASCTAAPDAPVLDDHSSIGAHSVLVSSPATDAAFNTQRRDGEGAPQQPSAGQANPAGLLAPPTSSSRNDHSSHSSKAHRHRPVSPPLMRSHSWDRVLPTFVRAPPFSADKENEEERSIVRFHNNDGHSSGAASGASGSGGSAAPAPATPPHPTPPTSPPPPPAMWSMPPIRSTPSPPMPITPHAAIAPSQQQPTTQAARAASSSSSNPAARLAAVAASAATAAGGGGASPRSRSRVSPVPRVLSRGSSVAWRRLRSSFHLFHALRNNRKDSLLHSLAHYEAHGDARTVAPHARNLQAHIKLLTDPLRPSASTRDLSLNEQASRIVRAPLHNPPVLSQAADLIAHQPVYHPDTQVASSAALGDEEDLENALLEMPTLHVINSLSSDMDDDRELVCVFIQQLGIALFTAGLPAHMVHFYLLLMTDHFGISLKLVGGYNAFMVQFGDAPHCRLVQGHPSGDPSLNKLVRIVVITENILNGHCAPIQGLLQLEVVLQSPPRYPPWAFVLSTAFFNAFYAPLFDGGWSEMGIAFLAGIFNGLLDIWVPNNPLIERGHDLLVALVTTFIAVLWISYIDTNVSLMAAIISGCCWSLPGLRLVLAVLDISTGHPTNGLAQFLGGMLTFANLGIGIAAGLQLMTVTAGHPGDFFVRPQAPDRFELWTWPLWGLASVPPLMILLDATLSHLPQLVLGTAVTFVFATWSTDIVGITPGIWISACAMGLCSNFYGRHSRWPGLELTLFSVMILLPEAIGVQSMLTRDSLDSVDFIVQMMIQTLALITGLLTANAIIRPDASI